MLYLFGKQIRMMMETLVYWQAVMRVYRDRGDAEADLLWDAVGKDFDKVLAALKSMRKNLKSLNVDV